MFAVIRTGFYSAAFLGLSATLAGVNAQALPTLQSGDCGEKTLSNYLCGPVNAEELVHLEGTPWVFGSQLGAPFIQKGVIYVINADTREWGAYELDEIEKRLEAPFDRCPAELTSAGFVGHGMTLDQSGDGSARLYAVNHGAHESVEVFSLQDDGDGVPELTWNGCIPSPDGAYLNTLAVLPDGGLVASKFFDISNGNWVSDLAEAKLTGEFYEWHQTGWSMIPDTEMSGPNGVVPLDGGESLLLAEWGGRKLHKVSRDGAAEPVTVGLQHMPDNIHFGDDGRPLVVAQTAPDLDAFNACMASSDTICPGGFVVIAIDPETMETETLISADPQASVFGTGTTALDLGDEIWVGTLRGDKIAIFKK